LKRRDFLKHSLAVSIAGTLPRVSFLAEAPELQSLTVDKESLAAQMIWCADAVPVPLKANGPAAGIASSSDGHPRVETPDLHAAFAREFTLNSAPVDASIRIFAYTRYRLYVNGAYCGRGPCRFQNQRPEYDTRPIGAALRPGRNTIAILVHRDAPTGRIMRHDPGLAAVVEIAEKSGKQVIETDVRWLATPELSFGPRDEAWASIEEHIDARKALKLEDPQLSFAGWAACIPASGPDFLPVHRRSTPLQLEARRSWSAKPAQNETPPFRLAAGDQATFRLAEIVQGYHLLRFVAERDSELEVDYLLPQGARSGQGSYVAREGVQIWMGGDTFAMNQFAVRVKSGRVDLEVAEVFEMRYPFERAASFACSDPFLTQLWNLCARSLELLSEDSYVDCADRERVEWTDDSPPAFDCTRVMMRGPNDGGKQYWGDNRLLRGLLRRIAATQQADGQIKAHSCSDRWDIHAIMEDRSGDWVILLREYFESSDDRSLVRELWPALLRLMRWFLDRRTGRGLVQAREWEVWDNPLRYQVCEGAGLNAFVYRALRDAAWLGNQLGESAASKAFSGDADRLHADFNALLWDTREGSYLGGLFGPGSKTSDRLDGKMFTGPFVDGRYQPTAQASLFALYCGLVPTERLSAVRNWLMAHPDEVQGPMSHYYLFRALYGAEEPKQDRLVLDRMRAGWKLQLESPWQTTWEDLADNGGSKAHMYGMAPGSFLTTHVLGARRLGPIPDRSLVIEPRCGTLAWARGVAVTEFGPVQMEWTNSADSGLVIECSVPENTKTVVRLYRQGNRVTVWVDGEGVEGAATDRFLEIPLRPGKHKIRYPV